MVKESPGVVMPMVIRRRRGRRAVLAESLPHGQVGGPIAEALPTGRDAEEMARVASQCALEVFIYPELSDFRLTGWTRHVHTFHEVDISGGASMVWEGATRNCRTAARHAVRRGIQIVPLTDSAFLSQVASLHTQQQQARRARRYPARWIERLVVQMPAQVGLWGALYEGRLMAALLMGWHRDAAVALLSTSDPEARPMKAGNLLYLTVLEALTERGVRTVDLGGSRGLPALEAFKRSLGGRCVSRVFYRHCHPVLRLYQRMQRARYD